MIAALVVALVAIACAAASVRRIAFVTEATALDPDAVLATLRGDRGRRQSPAVLAFLRTQAEGTFERELAEALEAPPEARPICVAQVETEFAWALRRWDRVPRVCASISSSTAFLAGSLVLRDGLTFPDGAFPHYDGIVFRAFAVVTVGMAGTAAALAAQRVATQLARARKASVVALVERLEECVEGEPSNSGNFSSPNESTPSTL